MMRVKRVWNSQPVTDECASNIADYIYDWFGNGVRYYFTLYPDGDVGYESEKYIDELRISGRGAVVKAYDHSKPVDIADKAAIREWIEEQEKNGKRLFLHTTLGTGYNNGIQSLRWRPLTTEERIEELLSP